MMTSSDGNIFRVTGLYSGNSPVTGEFPAQRPVMQSFDVFYDLRLNQQSSKQWRRRWFETSSCPLWRHCNVGRRKLHSWCRGVFCTWDHLWIYNPTKAHIWRSERTRKHLPEYPDWDIIDAVPSAPSDALAIAMTSQWAQWLLKSPASRLFTESFSQAQIKETSKLRVTGLCEGNSPMTGEFPAQTAINAVNVSIWWRHHTVLENLINWLIITHRHSVTEKQARVVK